MKCCKLIPPALLFSCTLFNQLVADPLFEIGDLIEVFFSGSSTGRFESNVYRNEINHQKDFLTIVSPGFEVLIGNPNSMSFGNIFIREDFYFYTDHNKLDREDFNIFLEGHHRRAHLVVDANASFIQQAQNTPNENALDTLIRSNVSSASIKGSYTFSPKTTMDVGPEFKYVDYKTILFDQLIDRYEYSLPIAVYHKYSPKLEFGPSYRYMYTDEKSERKYDFNDHFFGLAVRGRMTPKLAFDLHVGCSIRNINNKLERETFGIRFGSVWNASDKITVSGKAFRQYGAGGFADSILNTGGYLRADYTINDKWKAYASVAYNNADYQLIVREDNSAQTEVQVSYQVHKAVMLSLAHVYQVNSSNLNGASYENHMVYLTLEIHY